MARRILLPLVLTALLAGCGGALPRKPVAPMPVPGMPEAQHGDIEVPALPPAGSGRGGYYLDDGPGDHPPPNLDSVPDAQVKEEAPIPRANRPYVVFGKTYTPITDDEPFTQRGIGSWYGEKFHGQRTSSGELYDMYKMTAAHPTLPIPSYARVTNAATGKSVVVRINDRGPFHSDRIIDLSYTAALKLGLLGKGSREVIVERLLPGQQNEAARQRSAPQETPAPSAAAPSEVTALMLDDRAPEAAAAAPAPETPDGTAMPPEPGPGYYLQFGSYSRADKAGEERTRLQAFGGALSSLRVVVSGAVHRLLAGPFDSRAAALDAAHALPSSLKLRPIVVKR